ncbi:dimethylamine monooxygenase subunit DmmA family protein [Methylophilus methylotrophus]|uniref:dimethylamine monooxygenase subunit DmmA family protein n=1 Tax=Methylophilus methylotrophus TaxID=17 RepID=UPI0003786788|nr:dimethylamine monooxygenase subunit DmmA family protein [Methylophilus methylotrophus]
MERGYWIKSKPIYTSLTWHEKATSHLVLATGIGGMAVLKLFQQMHPTQPVTVLYGKYGQIELDYSDTLKSIIQDDLHLYKFEEDLLKKLQVLLRDATMGLRIYVAGSEGFIWDVVAAAKPFGIQESEIMKEQVDTLARTVYCVHCKTITKYVTTNITCCNGCERMLFVRDHFSRNLGAYMGLMVDAESPGELPAIEEIYP